MNTFQNDFMTALANIQEICVQTALTKNTSFKTKEDELNSVTSDLIYRIMAFIDGYDDMNIGKLDIISISTGKSLKKDPYIELHDAVSSYIKE